MSAINFNSIWFDKKGMTVQQTTYPKRSIKEILDSTYKVLEEEARGFVVAIVSLQNKLNVHKVDT